MRFLSIKALREQINGWKKAINRLHLKVCLVSCSKEEWCIYKINFILENIRLYKIWLYLKIVRTYTYFSI